jgi:hypothetical protein
MELNERGRRHSGHAACIAAVALACGLCLLAAPSRAASVSYMLDRSNRLDDSAPYLQVTISDGADGAVGFRVETLVSLMPSPAQRRFGIQRFALNVDPDIAAEAIDVSGLPEGWRVREGQRMGGFGMFAIALVGNARARADILTFSITGIDGDDPLDYALSSTGQVREGPAFFAAFVGGLQHEGIGQDLGYPAGAAFFGGSAVVPLPAVGWLMLPTVVATLRFARRRGRVTNTFP